MSLRSRVALLVVAVLVAGLGSSIGFAGSFTGEWSGLLEFDEVLGFTSLETTLYAGYEINDWTLAGTFVFDEDGVGYSFFKSVGTLGPVDLYAETVFVRWNPRWFDGLILSARTTLAGIDTYSIFLLGEMQATPEIGTAWLVGCEGTIGNASISAQCQFNTESSLIFLRYFGYEQLLDLFFYFQTCRGAWAHIPALRPDAAACNLPWTGADLVVEAPFNCFDLTTSVRITSEGGFDSFAVEAEDIELGIPWLKLGEVDCSYEMESKVVRMSFASQVWEGGCITPYITLETTETSITGLSLRALVAQYEAGGVTIKVGERFGSSSWTTWYEIKDEVMNLYAFSETGEVVGYNDSLIPVSCVYNADYEEYLGIEISGESCCASAFDMWIYTWFDLDGTEAIFDWAETMVNAEFAMGPHSRFSLKASYTTAGLNWFRVGWKIDW